MPTCTKPVLVLGGVRDGVKMSKDAAGICRTGGYYRGRGGSHPLQNKSFVHVHPEAT